MKRVAISVLLLIATCGMSRADATGEFMQANQAYAAGNFRAAADLYEKLAREKQWSASLFYNLANTYFRLADSGRAILNYERALALEPKHPEAEANLRLVRDRARALEIARSRAEQYLRKIAVNDYASVAAAAFWIALFALAVLRFRRGGAGAPAGILTLAVIVAIAAVPAIYFLETGAHGRGLAVVVNEDVQARLATAENANAVLALPPGSEVKILSRRGDWVYAALPNRLRGWIPATSAEPVRL